MPLTAESSYSEIYQHLTQLSTSSICDAFATVRLMDSKIHPVGDSEQCIGRAYTVNSEQDSLSTMQALDDLQAFLFSLDCADDIVPTLLVIASVGARHALAGGMCAAVAKHNGFSGIITDGYYRDIPEIKETGLPFFGKGKCAKSGTKDKIGTIRQPIVCGGISIDPGDIIFADVDGIVAMTKEEAVAAINKAEEIQTKESIAMQRIKEGARFNQICNIDEHIHKLQQGEPSKLEFTP